MKLNNTLILFSIALFTFAATTANAQSLPLVPQPVNLAIAEGRLQLEPEVLLNIPEDESWKNHLEIVATHIERLTNGKHRLVFADQNDATLQVMKAIGNAEGYKLAVDKESIQLTATSLKGLAHGTATLMQLIGASEDGSLPCCSIKDAAALPYRNFMVDMGRNPHSFELLKETIDLLWFYKIDSIQLHLTDDQRFAFPSTTFPKLWDGKVTLEQFKELETYAVARGVTIIPELEVPGHSGILRNRYPEVFGKTATDLAKDKEALKGIKTLLDEMMDIFSSTPYIHIGGDEAFGVPEELQRDLINTLHAYLKSKGKQTIVWEGPVPGEGDNKVDTEVIHINWRTINYPADKMLEHGYRVVNAAWDPLYLVDHYPRTNFTMTSPEHIYKTLKLTRFKHVNPGIRTFAKPVEVERSVRLIGFCMPWWEGREENYLTQIVPRLIPFGEVSWNPDVKRDFESFSERQSKTEAVRQAAFYPLKIKADQLAIESDGVFHNRTDVSFRGLPLNKSTDEFTIRYTLDGSQPTVESEEFIKPFELARSTTVRGALFKENQQVGHGSRRNFTAVTPAANLALGKPVTSSATSGSPFSVQRVNDGGTGKLDFYLGYPAEPKPIAITIDLEKVHNVGRIVVHAYTISNSFEKYFIEVSMDGKNFTEVDSRLEKPEKAESMVTHEFTPVNARFIRISSHGNKGYVFDSFSKIIEIQVFE